MYSYIWWLCLCLHIVCVCVFVYTSLRNQQIMYNVSFSIYFCPMLEILKMPSSKSYIVMMSVYLMPLLKGGDSFRLIVHICKYFSVGYVAMHKWGIASLASLPLESNSISHLANARHRIWIGAGLLACTHCTHHEVERVSLHQFDRIKQNKKKSYQLVTVVHWEWPVTTQCNTLQNWINIHAKGVQTPGNVDSVWHNFINLVNVRIIIFSKPKLLSIFVSFNWCGFCATMCPT